MGKGMCVCVTDVANYTRNDVQFRCLRLGDCCTWHCHPSESIAVRRKYILLLEFDTKHEGEWMGASRELV